VEKPDLNLDLLTSGSVHAELLPYTLCLASLVLIAQVTFLMESGHTQSKMHLMSDHPTHAIADAGIGNCFLSDNFQTTQ